MAQGREDDEEPRLSSGMTRTSSRSNRQRSTSRSRKYGKDNGEEASSSSSRRKKSGSSERSGRGERRSYSNERDSSSQKDRSRQSSRSSRRKDEGESTRSSRSQRGRRDTSGDGERSSQSRERSSRDRQRRYQSSRSSRQRSDNMGRSSRSSSRKITSQSSSETEATMETMDTRKTSFFERLMGGKNRDSDDESDGSGTTADGQDAACGWAAFCSPTAAGARSASFNGAESNSSSESTDSEGATSEYDRNRSGRGKNRGSRRSGGGESGVENRDAENGKKTSEEEADGTKERGNSENEKAEEKSNGKGDIQGTGSGESDGKTNDSAGKSLNKTLTEGSQSTNTDRKLGSASTASSSLVDAEYVGLRTKDIANQKERTSCAVVYNQYGKAKDVLNYNSVRPVPYAVYQKDVVVRVEGSSVSITDCRIRANKWHKTINLPNTPGIDCIGRVTQYADGAEQFGVKEGRRVAALNSKLGGNARYVMVSAPNLIPVPDEIDAEVFVSLVQSFLPAYQSIHRVGNTPGIEKGHNVLVTDGHAPFGQAVIQLAVLYGATAYAMTKTEHKGLVESLGGVFVDQDEVEWLTTVTDTMDLVMFQKGLDYFDLAHDTLKEGGRIICIGEYENWWKESIGNHVLSFWATGSSNQVFSYDLLMSCKGNMDIISEDLDALYDMVSNGMITPPETRVIQVSEVPDAQAELDEGPVEKVIVCMPWGPVEKKKKKKSTKKLKSKVKS